MEEKIYQTLKKHKLSPKKREEVLADLLLLLDEECKNNYSKEEVLKQLNILMSLPSSTLDKFTDDNGSITIKWFEQFKNK
jgi:hypothetical protein